MRILLLCDRVPESPGDGLGLRVIGLAREIARRHRIDLLCLHRPGQDPAALLPPGLFGRWFAVAQPPPASKSSRLAAPFTGWSPASLYVPSDGVRARLEHDLDPADYDVIWDAGAVLFTQLPPRWGDVPLVADLVDDMVLTFTRARHNATGWGQKARLWKYASVFARFEGRTMRRAARCVVVGDDDAAAFARVSRVPVAVVANGVDTDFFAPDTTPPIAGRLAFEGTLGFPPNAEAAQWLVDEIMPRVWAARPDASVALVGREPPPSLRALAGERVHVTGAVPDVRPWVREAEVFVCPLRSGAGIKNKLLQAWGMGRPVVATSMSVGGLAARDGVELLVRDGADAFAAGVLELLADPARRAALGAAGRAAACSRFTWQAMGAAFEALLCQAAAASTGSGRRAA